ncbi:DUF1203 domain-containing protein [Phyllobacterium sp. YR531]|uniref:DUF1203 domain-containing protein n=1 Tax=Phyllobacterium sp. YR531 TaxID=1144343 RepID=UPI00026F75AF|nr:DUF1203 domain-containing protein [Phyllobacterium sp. YR531]EJN01652.1 Protein of unknown function (DUF1203) [Phyllobacterium sp. YR531]
MAKVRFIAMTTTMARHYQSGGADANGQDPEIQVSDGDGVPCRHCLQNVGAGEKYLILSHRPFPAPQPYAETGPIFLHADECERHPEVAELPEMFNESKDFIVRGYSCQDRIVYGTGGVVETAQVTDRASVLLARDDVAYVHMRSARNNCFQCRIEAA